ncbi:MAG: hypothetical protein NVV74_14285 [Magnetospirillum sp.]|nr:hypothetical protein [Magnetospirillum sp.]
MLRNRPHSTITQPPWPSAAVEGDARIEALADLIDGLDLGSFFLDPAYRRQLNDVLACFSDEEFDSFERLYTRRFTIN